MSVASVILDQMGGPGFAVITGAKNFAADGNTLCMTLPRNKSRANRLHVTLTPMDDYTMRFFRHTNGRQDADVEVVEGVYCDTLQDVFTRVTGLAIHL